MGYREVVLADRPALYWPLGERNQADGLVFRDVSGYGRNSSASLNWPVQENGQKLLPSEPKGGSFSDGVNAPGTAYRSSESVLDPGTGDFAGEIWLLSNYGDGTYAELWSRDSAATGNGIIVYTRITDGGLHIWCAGTNLSLAFPTVTDGRLHHIVVTRRSGTVFAVVDGVEVGSVSAAGTPIQDALGLTVINRSLIGQRAHFAYYLKGLTTADCQRHHRAGLATPRARLHARR